MWVSYVGESGSAPWASTAFLVESKSRPAQTLEFRVGHVGAPPQEAKPVKVTFPVCARSTVISQDLHLSNFYKEPGSRLAKHKG